MPIGLAPTNKEMRVVRILADDKTKKHLESLGILVNSLITVISSVNGGVVINSLSEVKHFVFTMI